MFLGQVKNYHTEFYRPENLYLIITGMVKPEDVFEALKPFEEKIISKVGLHICTYRETVLKY